MTVNINLSNAKWIALAKGAAAAGVAAALAYFTGHSAEVAGGGGAAIVIFLEAAEAVLNFGVSTPPPEPLPVVVAPVVPAPPQQPVA